MKRILLLGGMLSSAALAIAGLALAQSPSPTPRPYLAKDAEEAIKFLGTWQRITSGQDLFKGATYVGSAGCGGAGCHDLQVNEWHQTWHSKILRDVASLPSTEVLGDFNGAVVPFKDIRAVPKGGDADLGKLQQVPVKFDVRTERANGKFFFVIVDPKDTNTPKGGQRYEVALVVGGKWQQTYHVRPAGQDGNPSDFFFPAPIRWSVNPDKSPGQPPGFWEVGNFQPENWVWFDNSELAIPRKPTELPVARFAEQKCMGCHTTGFDFAPIGAPAAAVHWSMTGNGELAVGCERCHGPGSKHVEIAKQKAAAGSKLDPERDPTLIVHGLKDLSLDQQNQVCGQCHARLGGKTQGVLGFPDAFDGKLFLPGDQNLAERALIWSYANPNSIPGQGFDNFWPDSRGKKSRTQWQDHIAGAHAVKAGASCMTCHTFHGDVVTKDPKDPQQASKLRQPAKELCESCHRIGGLAKQPNQEMYSGAPNLSASSQHADQGVVCADCHMGAVGQRMTKTTGGPTATAAAFDVSFHGTSIVPASPGTPPLGLFDERGNCEVCHADQRVMANGTVPPKKTPAELLDFINKIKNSTRDAVNKIQARAATNSNKDAKTELQLSNARANINMILLDGSMGFHNSRVGQNGDVAPEGGVGDCLRLANLWVELACRAAGANCTGDIFNPISGPITDPNPAICLGPKT
jgi:hypothetical protein